MGCLAGPVVAAAVILSPDNIPKGVDDSKKLSEKKRNELDLVIRETALCFSIAHAEVEEIDTINIYHAARLAMRRAIEGLSLRPDFVLMDGRGKIEMDLPQLAIVKGDSKSATIAAASIIAKVFRDKWMTRFDDEFPGYSFAKHKGYGSVLHRQCLQKNGPTPIHRKSFSWTPV